MKSNTNAGRHPNTAKMPEKGSRLTIQTSVPGSLQDDYLLIPTSDEEYNVDSTNGQGSQNKKPRPVEDGLYVVAKELETKIGRSYIIENMRKRSIKYFLKLPSQQAIAEPQSAERLAVHFHSELTTLRDLDVAESLDIGKVSRVLSQAWLLVRQQSDVENSKILRIPALLEEFIEGKSLPDWLDSLTGELDYLDDVREDIWVCLAFALTMTLRRMHNRGVIHASIRPDHIILGKYWSSDDTVRRLKAGNMTPDLVANLLKNVHLVGFGTSALLYDETHAKELADVLKKNGYAAPELKQARRTFGLYSYPADIYSLGSTLLYLLMSVGQRQSRSDVASEKTGMKDEADDVDRFLYEDVDDLKRHVAELSRTAAGSFKRWEGIARVIDKCLRQMPSDRYLCAEEMLRFIFNVASPNIRKAFVNVLLKKWQQNAIESLFTRSNNERVRLTKFVRDRLCDDWGMLIRSLCFNQVEYWGSRDVLIDHLSALLSGLNEKDEYCTVTLPGYWTNKNLGINGRFLVLNKELARRGVRIRRVFLVADPFDQLPIEEQQVLLAQQEAVDDVIGTPGAEELRVNVLRADKFRRRNDEFRLDTLQRRLVAFIKDDTGNKSASRVGISFLSHGEPYK